jgi:chain length determinant protein EpsF
MSLQQFLLALRARFGVFLLVVAATVLAAATVSLILPRSYKATVSLLVDARDEQSLSNAQRPLILPQERLSYMQTQKDILGSKNVARKVVRELKLAQDPETRARLEEEGLRGASLEDRVVETTLRKLKVETSQSNVIEASYSSRDAALSARVANAFAHAYIATLLELRVAPARESAVWFDEQVKGLRANLEQAQAGLTRLHQRENIVSADERLDVENARLQALSEEVVRAQGQTSQWASREQQAHKFLERGGSPEALPDVLDNAFIQRLKGDLLLAEAQLQELSTQYGPNHPQYQRQASENRSLRQKLTIEMRKVVSGIESSARQSRQREAEAVKALAAQRSRMLGLKQNRNEFTILKRNVESAERAYDIALQRSVASLVDSRANQTNVTVLNPALAPSVPASPKLLLNFALAVVVGVMLGIGMVMLLEMFDRRVRSLDDLENAWNVPLLGELKPWKPARRLLGRAGRHPHALPSPG